MNKTVLLIGAMLIFLIANVLMLTFVLNRSQQETTARQLASTDDGAAQPGATGTGDAGAAMTSSGVPVDPVAFKTAMDIGKTGFVTCAACHGPDAKGLPVGPQLMAPTLVGSQIALGDPDRAALVVLKGIKKETNDYIGLMAPLPIDDQQLAGILTYVRNSFGNKASLVTPEEVAAARARFASVPSLVSRGGIDSLVASNPKVAVPAAASGGLATTTVATTSLPPAVEEPWVPIPGIKIVGGRVPSRRPENCAFVDVDAKGGQLVHTRHARHHRPLPGKPEVS